MKLMFEDEIGPFNITPDEWGKAAGTLTAFGGCGQRWSDVTADRILADLKRKTKEIKKMKKLGTPGVTVAAGKNAYATLRKKFPEDIELVKIVECVHLGDNECYAIKNEGFR